MVRTFAFAVGLFVLVATVSAQEKQPPAGGLLGGFFGSAAKTPEQLDREAAQWIKSYDETDPPMWVESRKLFKEQPTVGVVGSKLKWEEVQKMVDNLYKAGALRVAFDVPSDFGDRKTVSTMYVIVGGKADVREKVLNSARETDKRLTELGCEGFMPAREPKKDDVNITLILQ